MTFLSPALDLSKTGRSFPFEWTLIKIRVSGSLGSELWRQMSSVSDEYLRRRPCRSDRGSIAHGPRLPCVEGPERRSREEGEDMG